MSDLELGILKKSIGSMRSSCVHCASCRRVPVPGEFVHRLPSERVVCSLCLAKVRLAEREQAVAERVYTSERHVTVAPRAA
ncbi:MAG TPA: hypothetical protein VD790_09845 [Thermoleophilaceae bacterium]|nr:hypothetical protein [Thermoleophilaceae bacterium]